MATLNEIAYNIRNIVSGGISSDDDNFSMRQLKFIINNQRANLLLNYTNSGRYIHPVVTQSIDWEFNASSRTQTLSGVPEILAFNGKRAIADLNLKSNDEGGNYAVKWNGGGLNKYNRFDKFAGVEYSDNPVVGARLVAVGSINNISISHLPRTGNWQFRLTAILADPRDAADYDDDTTTYPFPEEMITLLTQRVISKEYAIKLQSSVDLLNNSMDDKNVSGDKKQIDSGSIEQDAS